MGIRKIIFRGKRLDNGEWVYGSLLLGEKQSVIATVKGDAVNVHDCFEVDPATVGQFTGLLDKDGREIYEGDVIKTPLGNVVSIGFGYKEHIVPHGRPRFTDSFAAYGWIASNLEIGITDFVDNSFLSGEVIGNIHDNPELLNKK